MNTLNRFKEVEGGAEAAVLTPLVLANFFSLRFVPANLGMSDAHGGHST